MRSPRRHRESPAGSSPVPSQGPAARGFPTSAPHGSDLQEALAGTAEGERSVGSGEGRGCFRRVSPPVATEVGPGGGLARVGGGGGLVRLSSLARRSALPPPRPTSLSRRRRAGRSAGVAGPSRRQTGANCDVRGAHRSGRRRELDVAPAHRLDHSPPAPAMGTPTARRSGLPTVGSRLCRRRGAAQAQRRRRRRADDLHARPRGTRPRTTGARTARSSSRAVISRGSTPFRPPGARRSSSSSRTPSGVRAS